MGAGEKLERIKSLFHWGLLINFPFTFLIALSCFLFPEWIIRIFITTPSIVTIGADYLKIICFGYLLLHFYMLVMASLTGLEKEGSP
ncbi:hypothetical protein KQR57_04955 [Bacillus inaquosorum]|nr:hypothetical protein [Bacillus inaquosorum]